MMKSNNVTGDKYDENVPTSWNYGSFNPGSGYFSRVNLHILSNENSPKIKSRTSKPPKHKELRYSDPEFAKAFQTISKCSPYLLEKMILFELKCCQLEK